ncbi:MAG: lipoprotein insertase outer membrane protein LolB [Gammaproteobacteria bacterium]
MFRTQPITHVVRALLLAGLAALSVACTAIPTQLSGSDHEPAWQARQQRLSSLQAWNLTGRISIQAKREGWHAGLYWAQRSTDYDINLSSPLGQDILRLHGGPDGVVMRSSDGEQRAATADALLYKRLGWRLPLSGLRFWALGLPDATASAISPQDRELDALGRLTRLRQSGWEIEFRHYTSVAGIDLPDKIFLNNRQTGTQLEVRLAVEKWEIGTNLSTN